MKKGVSLIEALILVMILAVLLHLGAVTFQRMEPLYRLQAGVWEVLSGLNQARFKAMLEDTPVRVRFSSGALTLDEWDETREAWHAGEAFLAQGIVLGANNSPIFQPEGTVSNMASITVSNARGAYKISLAITGRAKVTKL
jgi:Tfp pilus assembly protein FimT